MNLLKTFIKKLRENGFSKDDIRFIGAQEILRNKLKNKTISELSNEIKINSGSLSYMIKGRRTIPLRLLNNIKSNYKIAIKGSNNPIKIPTILTKELSYCVGMLRDGTVIKEKNGEYTCAFYNNNIKILEIIKKYIKSIFDIDCKIENFGDTHGIRIRSLTLYLFFKLLFDSKQKQIDWDTPQLIKKTNNQIKKAYITGFFDAEGGVPHVEKGIKISKKTLYVKFVQKNKESLEFIKNYLEKNNIKMRSIYWEKEKWVLKVSNKSIPKFVTFIKPLHPDKAERLREVSKYFS